MRLLDDEIESEDRSLGERGREQTGKRAQQQRESVCLQVADRVHRVRHEAVGTTRYRFARQLRLEEIPPVVRVAAEGARRPELRAEPDDRERRSERDGCSERYGQAYRVSRRETERHERD